MKAQVNSSSSILPLINVQETQKTSEKYLQQYCQATNIQNPSQLQQRKSELLTNIKQGFIYNELDQFRKLQVRILRFTKNYECLQLEIQLGRFVVPNIKLINLNHESPTHLKKTIGRGGFSQIYMQSFDHCTHAIKCYPKKKWDTTQNILETILNEYCLLKVASALKVGPQMKEYYGFDIVGYKECFQFRMEYCNDPLERKINMQLINDQLKENLLRLHAFNIIHNDIKVDNIAFSPFFNSFIFIDFNLSRVIDEKIGMKTFTSFRGTPTFCSPQMSQLCQKQEMRFIDLYYNDLFGLKESINSLNQKSQILTDKTCIQQYFQENTLSSVSPISPQQYTFRLKFLIFQQDIDSIKQFYLSHLCQNQLKQIIGFLTLQPSDKKNRQIKKLLLRNQRVRNIYRYDKQMNLNLNLNDYNEQLRFRLKMLFFINEDDRSEYFINQMRNHRKQEVFQLFSSINKVLKNPSDYMYILAKAIKINSTPFTLQQAQIICQKAIQQLKIEKDSQINPKNEFIDDSFAQVSYFLFKQSLKKKLEGKYCKIFQEILVNIIICKVIPINDIIAFYEEILEKEISFQNKALILLKIRNCAKWLDKQSSLNDRQNLFSALKQLDEKILKKALQSKKYSQKEQIILKVILFSHTYYEFEQIFTQFVQLGTELTNQLIIFDLSQAFRFSSQITDKKVFLFQEYLQKRKQYDYSYFDRSQLVLIKINMLEQDNTKLRKSYQKYDSTFKLRKETGYKKLLKFYLQDRLQWQISKNSLKIKMQYLKKILPQINNYEHMLLFKFTFLALRIHFDKIEANCKEILPIFYNFTHQLLSSFSQQNLRQHCLTPLCMIIEKIQFYQYAQIRGIKQSGIDYSRSECYRDYLSIELPLNEDQKDNSFINKLLVLSKILYFFNRRYESMSLLTKLLRVSKYNHYILRTILQFIFFRIFHHKEHFYRQSFLVNCSLIYDQIIKTKNLQSIYFFFHTLYDEILMVLFKNNQERCTQLIIKFSNLVYLNPSSKNIKIYCDSIDRFIGINITEKKFMMFYQRLISMTDTQNNPFDFIIIYYGFQKLDIGDINHTYSQFRKFASVFGKQTQGIFQWYLNMVYADQNKLNIRKNSLLYRQTVRFRIFAITLQQVIRLFIKKRSKVELSKKQNLKKYIILKKKMRYFLINPIKSEFKVFEKLAFKWNRIYHRNCQTDQHSQ